MGEIQGAVEEMPDHGFEDWVQIELFYNGLNGQTRGTVDAAAGGTIFAKSPEQAYDLLEQMTINRYQWPSERAGVKGTTGVYVVDPITSLTAQVSALTTQIAGMNKNRGQLPSNTEVNPKEQCKAVTLMSGKELEVQIPKERVEREKTVEEGETEYMEEDHDDPLILGRPFLATGRALIDVHKGEITLRFGGEAVIFNIYHAMKESNEELGILWRAV
ncbi:uncharacterized protein [Primulina eburnea]|uniref:uncharacterized protein n=1 Tax=Primulina eburnea TaxID=1245227 RepID=UPI003C6C2EFE